VLVAMGILAGSSLYGADGSITLAIVIDGSNKEDRAPLQAYLTKDGTVGKCRSSRHV